MAFIRKVKTSGATAVQIAHKAYGRVTKIDHIGSAHTKEDIETLLELSRKQLLGKQMPLFTQAELPLKINLIQSVSRLLFNTLLG